IKEQAISETGFLDNLRPGATWIDFSTVNPGFTQEMAAEAKRRNIRFVDAPVAGSSLPAEKGELVIFAGGSENDLKDIEPLFNAIGRKTVYLGETGKGTAMKMVVNLILANAMVSFAEGVNLGKSLGLDYETIAGALIGGPVTAPFLSAKNEKIASGNYSAEFPLKHMLKDLFLATLEGYHHNTPLPQTSATRELFALAVKQGLGDLDFSAVYKLLE
ncbi:MAG TPA: NAD(P)-dependent oxidoreductase, partial [Bacteroidales bacterium]|nr:NAD(P)-dependent oxidoreductase [Bacteroidales bacterium]